MYLKEEREKERESCPMVILLILHSSLKCQKLTKREKGKKAKHVAKGCKYLLNYSVCHSIVEIQR